MKVYNRNEPLLSIHIPKTGGSSFRDVLYKWYGDHLFYHYFDEKENKIPIKHNFSSKICIHGHFNSKRGFGTKQYYPQANQFITFLRDPFEILVSRFYYVKGNENFRESYKNGQHLLLPENINNYLENEIENINYHPNILDYFPYNLTKENYKEIIEKNFVFIGLMEDYQNSIEKLAKILGFSSIPIAKKNTSEKYGEITNGIKERFIKNHPFEFQVYNYIKKIIIINN